MRSPEHGQSIAQPSVKWPAARSQSFSCMAAQNDSTTARLVMVAQHSAAGLSSPFWEQAVLRGAVAGGVSVDVAVGCWAASRLHALPVQHVVPRLQRLRPAVRDHDGLPPAAGLSLADVLRHVSHRYKLV